MNEHTGALALKRVDFDSLAPMIININGPPLDVDKTNFAIDYRFVLFISLISVSFIR